MSIINKYLIREIFKYLGIVLAVVISIYLAVDFFEKIDNFIEAKVSLSRVFIFFAFKIPFIVGQITPVGILLSILIVFGLMAKNNEIVALKSSGVSIYYLLKSVLLIGVLSGLFLFLFSEIIVPLTMGKANKIWLGEVKKESVVISREKNIWIKGNRLITHIRYYDPADNAILGVTLNNFDENFRLIKRIDAQKRIFRQGKWVLYELMEQNLNKEDGAYRVTFHEEKVVPLDFLPEDLKRNVKKSEEMSFMELLSYINKIEAEGYDATIYRVNLYAKTAFSFVCIIMCIMGTGIAFKGKVKDGLPLSIAYGIGIAFLYWIFYSFCLSLGYGGMLLPFIAAWIANLIFLFIGVIILLSAE